ncbi:AraC family transcriptional regulator [Halioxenophilus aromaticivorans]|uniref:AraC family transcriptional regulator n=1 Tax=Halioxenophilus aromaticivorans TaxID=1306992 RepID=A0AAV3U5A0_9ALTE
MMQVDQAELMRILANSVASVTGQEVAVETQVPGLSAFKISTMSSPMAGFYEPSVCLIAQGAKRVQLGKETYYYDTENYLFSGLHLPVMAQALAVSETTPYLGLKLTFDQKEITQLIADGHLPTPSRHGNGRGMATGQLTPQLIEPFIKLLNLLDEPEHIPALAPLYRKEIFYRLLVGEQGSLLRQLTAMGTQSSQVAKSITWLKMNFAQAVRVEDLAEIASMGVSTYHHHFRTMAAMSPLQYVKQLRLQEARRLMLSEDLDAASASYKVGYESPSQFSREYSRLYGCSPAKDISNIRGSLVHRSA